MDKHQQWQLAIDRRDSSNQVSGHRARLSFGRRQEIVWDCV